MSATPKLSVVVATYQMRREAYRTVYSLTRGQTDVEAADYEIVVVDNGSPDPVDDALFDTCDAAVRVVRMPDPTPSPAAALDHGVTLARGGIIVSMIDGARMASPGCIAWTLKAFDLFEHPIVTVPSWHIGPDVQNVSVSRGYDQAVEDKLFETIDWKSDGYRLFDISRCLDPSSSRGGWFGAATESNFIGLRRDDYERLGGFDPAFSSRGGGMVNLDFFLRACETIAGPVVSLIGEGTFHQFHGGVSTNVKLEDHPWERLHEEYRRIRGKDYRWPDYTPVQLGRLGSHAARWLSRSRDALTDLPRPIHWRERVTRAAAVLRGRL